MADLFMDFKGIQVTLAVMARALIDDRIDCKTAGRLAVELQMVSKLLWMVHRKGREGRKGNQISPQIYAEERRSGREGLQEMPAVLPESPKIQAGTNWAANQREEKRIVLVAKAPVSGNSRKWPHRPPGWARTA